MKQDKRGRNYQEFSMGTDESVRVTYIPDPNWLNEPTIRIQKREANGHLVQGEEFPASRVLDLFRSVIAVLPEEAPAGRKPAGQGEETHASGWDARRADAARARPV
jgi:hypothetical protein